MENYDEVEQNVEQLEDELEEVEEELEQKEEGFLECERWLFGHYRKHHHLLKKYKPQRIPLQ